MSDVGTVVEREPSRSTHSPRRTFQNALTRRLQQRHFWLFWALPNLLTLLLLPAVGFPTATELSLFVAGWATTTIGVSVGFHRLFTHKSFQTVPAVEGTLAVCGMMAGGGSLVSWVAIHRRHHQKSDQPGDPHSPLGPEGQCHKTLAKRISGYLHAHSGWMYRHDYPDPMHFCRDLYKKPWLISLSKYYHLWLILGLILPGVVNGLMELSWLGFLRGAFFGGLLRMVLVHHFISAVNSVCHGVGTQRYATGDLSTNCWWLAIPTVGESWHNNHHGKQTSAYFGHAWWEIDLGGYVIRLLACLGLAWHIHGYRCSETAKNGAKIMGTKCK